MGLSSGRRTTLLGAAVAMLAAACMFAPSAGAELVHVGAHQVAGVTPINGVNPAAIPGSAARRSSLAASEFAPTGNLDYNGGPVLHASSPFLIFWDPGSQISAANKTLFERFFADVAHDSGLATNVYSVDRQFTDGSGFADYSQTWSAGHAIIDTQPFPSSGQCNENAGFTETACLFDSQIQAEVQRLVAADGLPTGVSGNAPIYFVVTPPTVNSCFSDDSTCADDFFCAYHSSFSIGSSTALYANIPTLLAVNDPKGCQADSDPPTTPVQHPNGAATQIADVAIKYMSHEDNETITDPVDGTGWVDDTTGQEDGDNCNFTGPFDPGNDTNPNAFLPTLGGTAGAQTLFDQLINSHQYYIQSEWSNGDANCKMRPTTSATSAVFSAPTVVSQGQSLSFNPTGSSSAGGFTSTTWSFGDGGSSFSRSAPASVSHSYASPGTFHPSLTLVDKFGNLSTVSHQVTTPIPVFTDTPASPLVGTPVSFDSSGSHEPGGSISSSRSWDFSDGSAANGSTPSHTFASPGVYPVSLRVTDNTAHTATISHTVTVHGFPAARFAVSTSSPAAGSPVGFNGSGSGEPEGSILSFSWNFGDGSASGSGVSPSHAYAHAGAYTIKLTVTDGFGTTANASRTISVVGVPSAAIAGPSATPVTGVPVSLSGAGSADTGSTISSYSWRFGDGSTGSGASTSHIYSTAGGHAVVLKVTDASGATSTTATTLTVKNASITSVKIKKGKKVEKLKVSVTGPGRLRAGSATTNASGPGTFTLSIKLSKAQRARLNGHHSVTLRVKLKFAPTFGSASSEPLKIKIPG